MRETMTYVGLDVHARSTHGAALDVLTGELHRARFDGDSEEVIDWLRTLPQPLHGCYEAGPTGFALYRAAEAAGLQLDVIARRRRRGHPETGSRAIAKTPSCWRGFCSLVS